MGRLTARIRDADASLRRVLGLTLVSGIFLSSIVNGSEVTGPLAVHLLSGSEEYASDNSLRSWAEHLQARYGITSIVSNGPDRATFVPNLESLPQADVLVVFCRRWELTDEQAAQIMDWIDSGKPILAIRTASHAFQFFTEFDSTILGGDYSGHGKGDLPVRVILNPEQRTNPILTGIETWERTGKLYHNPDPARDITILLTSDSEDPPQPLAWTRLNRVQRVFYTSMGLPEDFENPTFIRLLDNALFWVADSPQMPIRSSRKTILDSRR
jgi:type 1 glutamine amidotransferase